MVGMRAVGMRAVAMCAVAMRVVAMRVVAATCEVGQVGRGGLRVQLGVQRHGVQLLAQGVQRVALGGQGAVAVKPVESVGRLGREGGLRGGGGGLRLRLGLRLGLLGLGFGLLLFFGLEGEERR